MRRLPLLIFALMAYLFWVLLLQQYGPAGGVQGASNKPMPALTLGALDGDAVWQPEALVGKVTVLNFFASWCTPCAREMPELAALKKQFPALRLEGVAWNDTPQNLHSWLREHHNPFDQVWFDKTGDATMALGIRGIPETFVIDAQGIVRYRLVGGLSAERRTRELAPLLTTLLAEATRAR